ncbi:MAG TPA: hypothetical protein PK127_06265 [Clostridiales bacterium]|nr:hypothetical protein [Clostridiales bacterium]HPV02063.1 hypothetical protein [Clostridiales bacterium]
MNHRKKTNMTEIDDLIEFLQMRAEPYVSAARPDHLGSRDPAGEGPSLKAMTSRPSR